MAVPAGLPSSAARSSEGSRSFQELLQQKQTAWDRVCNKFVQNRTPPGQVLSHIKNIQASAWSTTPRSIVGSLLSNSNHGCNVSDPIVPRYIRALVENGVVQLDDVLWELFTRSTHHLRLRKGTQDLNIDPLTKLRQSGLFVPVGLECDILEELPNALISPTTQWRPQQREIISLMAVFNRWLPEVCLNDNYPEVKALGLPEYSVEYTRSHEFYDSLAILVISVLQHPDVMNLCSTRIPRALGAHLQSSLSQFAIFLAQHSSELSGRLVSTWQANPLYHPPAESVESEVEEIGPAIERINPNVDRSSLHSRSGMLIFMSSLMISIPLTDEVLIIQYLESRYGGDIQLMASNVVLATFDLLANGMYRSENSDSMFALRSLAINKLPIVLAILNRSLTDPRAMEACIKEALAQIDPQIFPSFSESFMMGQGKTLSDVRQDFISACRLHGLLSNEAFQSDGMFSDRMLDSSSSTDRKKDKRELIRRCRGSTLNIGNLVESLECLDGNAAAIVFALVDIVQDAAMRRDIKVLRTVASSVCRKTFFMDIILQFTSPSSFLKPFCEVMHTFEYEEEQEYQPVYEDFSTLMLLVQSFIVRFKFKPADLDLAEDSFIAKYIKKGHAAKPTDGLSEKSKKRLVLLTRGLFELDGNIDEALAECKPQQFYLLVPELFREILDGLTCGNLTMEAVKSGFDFLFETFLVPSLVSGLEWLCKYAEEQGTHLTSREQSEVLQLVQSLMVKPSSRSGEAPAMHRVVLSVTGLTLYTWLIGRLRIEPSADTAIRRMLETLQSITYYDPEFVFLAEKSRWTSSPGGVAAKLVETFDELVMWHAPADSGAQQEQPGEGRKAGPVKYTHALYITAFRDQLGASKVAEILIERVAEFIGRSERLGQLAVDVAISLVMAPLAGVPKKVWVPFRSQWPVSPAMATMSGSWALSPSPRADVNSRAFGFLLDGAGTGREECEFEVPSQWSLVSTMRQIGHQLASPNDWETGSMPDRSIEATYRIAVEMGRQLTRAATNLPFIRSQVVAYFSPELVEAAEGHMGAGVDPVGGVGPGLAAEAAAAAVVAGFPGGTPFEAAMKGAAGRAGGAGLASHQAASQLASQLGLGPGWAGAGGGSGGGQLGEEMFLNAGLFEFEGVDVSGDGFAVGPGPVPEPGPAGVVGLAMPQPQRAPGGGIGVGIGGGGPGRPGDVVGEGLFGFGGGAGAGFDFGTDLNFGTQFTVPGDDGGDGEEGGGVF